MDDEESSYEGTVPSCSWVLPRPRRLIRIGSFLFGFCSALLVVALLRRNLDYAGTGDDVLQSTDASSSVLGELFGEPVPAVSSSIHPPNLKPPVSLLADMDVGSCDVYGCNTWDDEAYLCHCNPECIINQNCCDDYETLCVDSVAWYPPVRRVQRGPPFGHPSTSVDYPQYPGFTLWLAEEFDAPLDLDTDPIWTYSDGGLSEGNVRFVKDAIKFRDGKMMIQVGKSGMQQGHPCSHAEVGYIGHKGLTSGEVRSRYNLFRYGLYEVRMKAPVVQPGNPDIDGNFISTMFVYRDAKFKHWREVDIEVTGDGPNTVTTNVLSGDHTAMWNPGIQDSAQKQISGINVRSEFHVYAFEWLPTSVRWFIDGNIVRWHTGGRVKIPDMSTKIMMNLWIFDGGAFGGSQIKNNRYPMHSEYDWFRFYKWDGEKQYPCKAMDKSCLSADDLYLTGNNPCDGIPQRGTVNGKVPCRATCRASRANRYKAAGLDTHDNSTVDVMEATLETADSAAPVPSSDLPDPVLQG